MKVVYIYGVWYLDIQKFVYIGKSNSPPARFGGHMKRSTNSCLRKLVEEKGVDNFRLIILEKTGFSVPRVWIKREKFWIAKFREEDHPLCNANNGGGGVTEHTEEAKVKISRANLGKEVSEETKANMSKARMGHEVTEETRVKLREANYGKIGYWAGKIGYWAGKKRPEMSGKNHPRGHTRPYLAFYNIRTKEYIPEGKNLMGLCKEYNLPYMTLWNLQHQITNQSCDGWHLATKQEIELNQTVS